MVPFWSHGRLKSIFGTFGILLVPIGLALGAGTWLGLQATDARRDQGDLIRLEELTAQNRLLVDNLWSAIESIRTQALSLHQLRTVQPDQAPAGAILDWAEIEMRGGTVVGIKQSVKNPNWRGDEEYLHAAMERVSLRELKENGVTALRVKQDPHRPNEWLALGFKLPAPQQGIVLALVDPMEAFSVFKRFVRRSEGGQLRAYLVNTDGFVLAHSQPSYVGSNFSSSALFTQAVHSMLQGARISGGGTYKAIDQVPVHVAYGRLGTLPFGVIVERTIGGKTGAGRGMGLTRRIFGQAVLAIGAILVVAFGFAYLLRRKFSLGGVRAPEQGEALEEIALDSELTATPDLSSVLSTDPIGQMEAEMISELPPRLNLQSSSVPPSGPASGARNASNDPDQLSLHEVPVEIPVTDESAAIQNAISTIQDKLEQEALAAAHFSQLPQEGFKPRPVDVATRIVGGYGRESEPAVLGGSVRQELMATQEALRATREEQALVSQFEMEAATLKDPKLIGQRLVTVTSQLCASPALFFMYHDTLRAAILQADAGFAPGAAPASMSFPVTDETLRKIMQSHQKGTSLSLSDYPPLAHILLSRIGVAHFEAWAITGYGHLGRQAAMPRILGVLVILQAGVESAIRHESITRMMRATGLIYENALLSQ